MPTPRLDDANIEFSFTEDEALIAQLLDPLKIAWYQTKYAQYWKTKNSTPMPEDPSQDRSYFLKVAETEGRLNMLQELMDDARKAMKSKAERDQALGMQSQESNLETKAASMVHIPSV